jgi:uncharacterized coiled-coil DUF342 family protein
MDLGKQKETKKELFSHLEKLRHEVNSYNKNLNKLNIDKESWFKKKENISNNIRNKIKSVKENRTKRDSLTKKVKELKEKRTDLNEDIKKKISPLVKLRDELKDLTKKSKIKYPQNTKRVIDAIEVKLETEAMPFDKEKELSKKLNQMKRSLSDASSIIDIQEQIKKLNLRTNSIRKNNNLTHNEIQKLAKESQESHVNLVKNSKEIDELKVREKEAHKKFFGLKKSFNEVNNKLEEKLIVMNKIKIKINKFKLEEEEKNKLKEIVFIKNKENELEEKIKEGKKLTTDDFLVFQDLIKNKKM